MESDVMISLVKELFGTVFEYISIKIYVLLMLISRWKLTHGLLEEGSDLAFSTGATPNRPCKCRKSCSRLIPATFMSPLSWKRKLSEMNGCPLSNVVLVKAIIAIFSPFITVTILFYALLRATGRWVWLTITAELTLPTNSEKGAFTIK